MSTNGNGSNSFEHYVTELKETEEQKRAAAGRARVILAEAQQAGFNPAALRDVVRVKMETRQQAEAREARANAFGDYLQQLGMLADAPPQKPAKATRARA